MADEDRLARVARALCAADGNDPEAMIEVGTEPIPPDDGWPRLCPGVPMPRFFFHRTDGDLDPDQEGVELPDLQAARVEAVKFAAISVKDHPELVWSGSTFRVEVSDHTGMLLSTVIILEIEAPAARGLRGQRPLDDNCLNSPRDRAID